MHSLGVGTRAGAGADSDLVSSRGRDSNEEGGRGCGVGPYLGTMVRSPPDALWLPDTVEVLDLNEIVPGGESKRTRNPDLRLNSDPPLLSPVSSTSSALFHEGLIRLDSFVALANLHREHPPVIENYENSIIQEELQTIDDPFYHHHHHPHHHHHHHYQQPQLQPQYTGSDRDQETASNSDHSDTSTFYGDLSLTIITADDSPSYQATFFDPSPSSVGPSPTTPNYYPSYHSWEPYDPMAPRAMYELSEPATRATTTYPTSAGGHIPVKNTQWRPQSAPKTTYSRSASPLLFWNRRGQQQQQDDREHTPATESRGGRDEEAYVDTVSNHLGRLPPPSLCELETPKASRDRDLRDLTKETADQLNLGPPETITKAEYEALPLAIQRKYFSTLERLRFAQESNGVDRIFDHYESQNPTHRKHRQALSSPDSLFLAVPKSRNLRESLATAISDSSWVVDYPEKVSKTDLTREEQVKLIKHLRASVILDAAGETITKLTRPTDRSQSPTPDIDNSTCTLSTRRGSLDSMASAVIESESNGGWDSTRASLYDSFRWLDKEDNLDLSLFLDDYHANLREEVPQTGKNRRPSFRRHLSITKLPFGRSSLSSSRPDMKETKDASPEQSPAAPQDQQANSTPRRLSRSILNANRQHSRPGSISVIDPAATHYQDPEARQKLRAYLASEQKFDEALQFGFPATDAPQGPPVLDQIPRKCQSRLGLQVDSEPMRSFLHFDGDDDDGEDDEDRDDRDDGSSVSDPDSPLTPQMCGGLTPPPGHHRPTRVSTEPLQQHNNTSSQLQSSVPPKPMSRDSYVPPASSMSREMTLRMTLTRPDLRADDELIYGWQPQVTYLPTGRKSLSPLPKDETPVLKGQTTTACWSETQANKESIENMFSELNNFGPDNHTMGERGVMKRIWNKVRRA